MGRRTCPTCGIWSAEPECGPDPRDARIAALESDLAAARAECERVREALREVLPMADCGSALSGPATRAVVDRARALVGKGGG
jgi:hypothetical protein